LLQKFLTLGEQVMKKSIGLLSALVVTTTFIVNCQKAPDSKRRVRPSGGSGISDVAVDAQKTTLPKNVCSKELLADYKTFGPLYKRASEKRVTDQSTAEETKAMQTDLVNVLVECNKIIPALTALGESENFSCFKDAGVKSESNALTKQQMDQWCKFAGQILEKDHNHPNEYSTAAKLDAQDKKAADKVKSELIGKSLSMSKESRQLLMAGNTDGVKFLVDGEIKSSNSSLEQGLAASSTVCTFLGDGLEIDENIDATLKIVSTSAADKNDLQVLKADFAGKATLLSTEVSQADKSIIGLLCLNLDSAKLTVEGITNALGKGITSATVTTDQPAAVSATVATTPSASAAVSAKPTSSVSAVVSVSATAAVSEPVDVVDDVEPVSATVVVSKPASAVVSVVTTGTASTTASATAQVASTPELASLQAKAAQLDKDATAAEAELATAQAAYDAEKNKGASADKTKLAKLESDLNDYKAVARNARASATSAKTEYDNAVRKAAPTEF
jgi:hypothetical protein